jgi:arginyl-tRNA synthetase
LDRLDDPCELALVRALASWPRAVESAAEAHEPHRIAYYLYDLASSFHTLWTKGKDESRLRFLLASDIDLTAARLALVHSVAIVIASGLDIFGVEALVEMR